jgi:ubiquinone/menaquinone biosynthesis C-methylase UbiE
MSHQAGIWQVEGEGTMTEIVQRYSSLAKHYNTYRPTPPQGLVDFIKSMAPPGGKMRIVDLGCGSGLSTRLWATRCDEVTGVDPSEEMLEAARAATKDNRVVFKRGWGHDTGLPSGYASIVTCASSFHWMEPKSTLREVGRILRPRGVLAIYGPQIPPVAEGFYSLAALFERFLNDMKELDFRESGDVTPLAMKWAEILQILKDNPNARYCNEFCFHQKVRWTASELCMWLCTVNYVHRHLTGTQATNLACYKQLKEETDRLLGDKAHTFLWCYRLILSVYA